MVSRYKHVDPEVLALAAREAMQATGQASLAPSSSAESFVSAFPMNIAPSEEQPEGFYHAQTALASGGAAILADPGAWTNAGGMQRMVQASKAAIAAGYTPTERKLPRRLAISGVGEGEQYCNWQMQVPIAVPLATPDGKPTGESAAMVFDAPCVEGSGSDLPLILGLRSISEKKGVLETDPEKRMLTLPGPGGYRVEWAPGAIHIPLTPAMSSHLMVPCDLFG